MGEQYNVYCDESCHLENDKQRAMVLGGVWCPAAKTREIITRLKEIKADHKLPAGEEVKWTKISPSKKRLYLDLLNYFFDDDDLHFRALVVPNKNDIDHEKFGQSHEEWYYKMYFTMLKTILSPHSTYKIYMDIMNTRGGHRIAMLREVLNSATSEYDYSRKIVKDVQLVRSHEVETIQLADLLIGAVSYVNRGLSGNAGKEAFIERMRKRSGYRLDTSTLPSEVKTNVFIWRPNYRGGF